MLAGVDRGSVFFNGEIITAVAAGPCDKHATQQRRGDRRTDSEGGGLHKESVILLMMKCSSANQRFCVCVCVCVDWSHLLRRLIPSAARGARESQAAAAAAAARTAANCPHTHTHTLSSFPADRFDKCVTEATQATNQTPPRPPQNKEKGQKQQNFPALFCRAAVFNHQPLFSAPLLRSPLPTAASRWPATSGRNSRVMCFPSGATGTMLIGVATS